MVDFRYHLVSIIAVFLALAVGIVLGTTALNGPVLDDLRGNIDRLTADKRGLEADVGGLRNQVEAADDFATTVGPGLVRGVLADQTVLLVTLPETPSELVDRTTQQLELSGAQVTGRLRLLPALSDPRQSSLVDDVVAGVIPAGIDLPAEGPVERATAELAAALARPSRGPAVEGAQAQAVVSAFEEADLVQYESNGDALRQASLLVVLSGPARTNDVDGAQVKAEQAGQDAVLSLASAFDRRARGALVAGPETSADDNGLIRRLRAASSVASEVSSVDNADRGVGLVAVALALGEQLRGEVGQYGAGDRAEAPLPGATGP
ncbi:MAG: uncharacterized protein JWN88_1114 [Frankiales bacterium]|jgi:hypothetical protein|nr:uncharacterized protein [Frankiales bacterium]